MDDEDFDFGGGDQMGFGGFGASSPTLPPQAALPSTQPHGSSFGGGGVEEPTQIHATLPYAVPLPPTSISSSFLAPQQQQQQTAAASSSSGADGGSSSGALVDFAELYRNFERGEIGGGADGGMGGGGMGGHGGGGSSSGYVGEGGHHEGSRNFQALLTLPTDRLPRTTLPKGVGSGSIRASLKAFVDSAKGRNRVASASLAAVAATAKEGAAAAAAASQQPPPPAIDFANIDESAPLMSMFVAPAASSSSATAAPAVNSGEVDEVARAAAAEASALAPLTDAATTYSHAAHRRERIVWSDEETRRFFDALQQYGTDFTLVSILFPGRRRQDIQRKYKQEWRLRPRLVEEALHAKAQMPVDLAQLDEGLRLWSEHSKPAIVPLTEEEERLLRQLGGGNGEAAAAEGGAEGTTGGDGGGNDFDFGAEGGGDGTAPTGGDGFDYSAGPYAGFGGGDPFAAFSGEGGGGDDDENATLAQRFGASANAAPTDANGFVAGAGDDFGFIFDPSASKVKPKAKRAAPKKAATKRDREDANGGGGGGSRAEECGDFGF